MQTRPIRLITTVWFPGTLVESLPSVSPQFWIGNPLTWSVMARIDGEVYNLLGVTHPSNGTAAKVTHANYTATHSAFTLSAGSEDFILDFFTPVSPKNYLRQSLPFSYLTVTVKGKRSSNVQIYSDIDASWTGMPDNSRSRVSGKGKDTMMYHISAVGTAPYTQNEQEQALWAEVIYASRGSKLSTATGAEANVRSQFMDGGALDDQHPEWSPGDVAAFTHDLGKVSKETSVTFAIGNIREKAINYMGEVQTGYYRATHPDARDALSHFLDDYEDALHESTQLDKLVQQGGESSHSSKYSDVLALSVRQVFGGIELTVPHDSMDVADARAFIKEISSDGNINTVDVIYATFPIFYLLNPDLLRLLTKPILQYMASDAYNKTYAVHDLGTHYPNATGHDPTGEAMPIEESGNMLILTYAYQLGTGKNDLLTDHSALFKQYALFLATKGEYPDYQLSLNDALGPIANQTNLGAKAAVALAAYGKLTSQPHYNQQGKRFAQAIWSGGLGTNPNDTHYTIQYGNKSSWFMVYNNYPDKLFHFNLFPEESYDATSKFYPTVRTPGGVALDSQLYWGQTNWQSFTAATVHGHARDMLISDLHAYISNGMNQVPFCDRYWVQDNGNHKAGEYWAFRARPTLGSHFALWAMKAGGNVWSG